MPDRVKLCEYCERTWYEEEQEPQQYSCLEDGTELIDVKLVYTEEELQDAIKQERELWKSFINIERTGYIGARVYVLSNISANRYDEAIRGKE